LLRFSLSILSFAFRKERAKERGVGPKDLEQKRVHKERILQDKIEREKRNKVAAATRQKRWQGLKEEKKRLAQERPLKSCLPLLQYIFLRIP
jgi:hypothetical protein